MRVGGGDNQGRLDGSNGGSSVCTRDGAINDIVPHYIYVALCIAQHAGTALMIASDGGHLEMVRALLAAGVNIEATAVVGDDAGDHGSLIDPNPLHDGGTTLVVRVNMHTCSMPGGCHDYDVALYVVQRSHYTALMVASQKHMYTTRTLEVVKALLAARPNVNALDAVGRGVVL